MSLSSTNYKCKQRQKLLADFEDRLREFTVLFYGIICAKKFNHRPSYYRQDMQHPRHYQLHSIILPIRTVNTGIKAMYKYYGTVLG
jgi:hypothetical protein